MRSLNLAYRKKLDDEVLREPVESHSSEIDARELPRWISSEHLFPSQFGLVGCLADKGAITAVGRNERYVLFSISQSDRSTRLRQWRTIRRVARLKSVLEANTVCGYRRIEFVQGVPIWLDDEPRSIGHALSAPRRGEVIALVLRRGVGESSLEDLIRETDRKTQKLFRLLGSRLAAADLCDALHEARFRSEVDPTFAHKFVSVLTAQILRTRYAHHVPLIAKVQSILNRELGRISDPLFLKGMKSNSEVRLRDVIVSTSAAAELQFAPLFSQRSTPGLFRLADVLLDLDAKRDSKSFESVILGYEQVQTLDKNLLRLALTIQALKRSVTASSLDELDQLIGLALKYSLFQESIQCSLKLPSELIAEKPLIRILEAVLGVTLNAKHSELPGVVLSSIQTAENSGKNCFIVRSRYGGNLRSISTVEPRVIWRPEFTGVGEEALYILEELADSRARIGL